MKKSLLALLILCLGFSLVTAHAATSGQCSGQSKLSRQGSRADAFGNHRRRDIAAHGRRHRGRMGLFSRGNAGAKSQAALVCRSVVLGASTSDCRHVFRERFRRRRPAADAEKTFRRGGNHRAQSQRSRGDGAFVQLPLRFSRGGTGDGASFSSLGFATIDLSWLYNSLMVPVMMAAFFIVFLASNAINIFIC